MNWKRGISILLVLLLVLGVTGCGAKAELPEGFSKEEVEEAGKEIITLLNAGDYQGVLDKGATALTDSLTAEELEAAVDASLKKLGTFDSYTKLVTGGNTNKETNESYAVTMITAKYSDGKAVYTLSFNKDMELIGIYMK